VKSEYLSKTNLYCFLTQHSLHRPLTDSHQDDLTSAYFLCLNVASAYEVKREELLTQLIVQLCQACKDTSHALVHIANTVMVISRAIKEPSQQILGPCLRLLEQRQDASETLTLKIVQMKKMLGENLDSFSGSIKSKILLAEASPRKLELLTVIEDQTFFQLCVEEATKALETRKSLLLDDHIVHLATLAKYKDYFAHLILSKKLKPSQIK
jgi:hypothetical protein